MGSFIIFSAIDVSSWTILSLWLYPNFFLNSMASDNLQHSIISRVKFPTIKIFASPSKYALYFSFSSYLMLFFLPQYFLILFNTTSAIFECPSCISIWLIFCHNSIIFSFSFVMFYCFNATFFPCFFCNFYNHFIHTHTKNKIFWWLFFIFYFFYLLFLFFIFILYFFKSLISRYSIS